MKKVKTMRPAAYVFLVAVLAVGCCRTVRGADAEPICPRSPIALFNGKNLDGLYTWLRDAKYEDPRGVFQVAGGALHISGDGFGYVATKRRYKDYHLVLEYRWGERTWQSRKNNARDSGLILHCVEPDGSFGGTFMAGIEAQVIEGGVGDILVVVDKLPDGSPAPVSLSAETAKDRDGETIWKQGVPRVAFDKFSRINWFGRDPDWEDVLGFRGPRDLDSPGQQWTRLDVVCDGGHIRFYVNGTLANEAFDARPSSGKILFQTEGAEIFVRRFELLPLDDQNPLVLQRRIDIA